MIVYRRALKVAGTLRVPWHLDGRHTECACYFGCGRRPRQDGRRPGFTLLEILVVIALLSIATGMVTVAILGTIKLERREAADFNRIQAQTQVADQFRADVAQATDVLDESGNYEAGPTTLVLALADNHHVVYTWYEGYLENHLKRTEIRQGHEATRPLPVGGFDVTVEFIRPADNDRLVTLRLIETRGLVRSRSTKQWPIDISTALGGDLR